MYVANAVVISIITLTTITLTQGGTKRPVAKYQTLHEPDIAM